MIWVALVAVQCSFFRGRFLVLPQVIPQCCLGASAWPQLEPGPASTIVRTVDLHCLQDAPSVVRAVRYDTRCDRVSGTQLDGEYHLPKQQLASRVRDSYRCRTA